MLITLPCWDSETSSFQVTGLDWAGAPGPGLEKKGVLGHVIPCWKCCHPCAEGEQEKIKLGDSRPLAPHRV